MTTLNKGEEFRMQLHQKTKHNQSISMPRSDDNHGTKTREKNRDTQDLTVTAQKQKR